MLAKAFAGLCSGDKGLLTADALHALTRCRDVPSALRSRDGARDLFDWIRRSFNGDLFPPDVGDEALALLPRHLDLCARFLEGEDLETGSLGMFPYRFDVIPVEIISSIYEQFAHASAGSDAKKQGLHYTPVNLVEMALGHALDGAGRQTCVLDPACGSGVFLVEAFRRLVRIRAQEEGGRSRDLVRDVLNRQLHGVDVNAGALQVAAFSLYLAALEMDPNLGGPIESLRFEPLIGRTLLQADFLDGSVLAGRSFDVIVGNPPWTYAGKAAGPAARPLGPVPARSPDWAFLWRARSLAVPAGRISLLMKATPFFSKTGTGVAARQAMLASFRDVHILNFSELRGEQLFPSVPDGSITSGPRNEPHAPRKANLAPALLFRAVVGQPAPNAEVRIANIAWTPGFRRHGVIGTPQRGGRSVSAATAGHSAAIMKAALFCNDRELEVMEALTRSPRLVRLKDWLGRHGLAADQGFQSGGGDRHPAAHLRGLPVLTAEDYTPSRLRTSLSAFSGSTAHRPREARVFRGPLVLCPEAGFAKAIELGRYSSAFSRDDVAFTDSFVGIGFPAARQDIAKAFSAILHSKLIAFQLAFGSSNVGLKQPKIERSDLDDLLIPELFDLPPRLMDSLLAGEGRLLTPARADESLKIIDEAVFRACALGHDDIAVLDTVLERSRALFLDTNGARRGTVAALTQAGAVAYAAAFTTSLDQALAKDSYLKTHEVEAIRFSSAMLGLRFAVRPGPPPFGGSFRMRTLELFEAVVTRTGRRGSSDVDAHEEAPTPKHQHEASDCAPAGVLIAFDLLMVAGEDLRPRPLAERRARLAEILVGAPPGLELSPHVTGEGPELLRAVCARGLEGVVAKRIDVETWIKAKCTERKSFAVIGFDPRGRKGVAALKLARLVDGALTPCGYVGSGISAAASGDMRQALDAGEHLVADVEFRGWTPAGELRHPVFKGWHR